MGHRPHRPQNNYRWVSNEGVPLDIIELLKSAFMGLVEGITEWLPVSSTGHMILVDEFVKMNVSETFWNMFLVVIQLGAILAVCVLFFYDLNPFSPSKGKEGRRDTWVLWGKIVLGCIPAAAIGLPLNDWMEEHFYNAPVVALALIVYGVLFIVIENWRANKRDQAALAGSFGLWLHHYARGPELEDRAGYWLLPGALADSWHIAFRLYHHRRPAAGLHALGGV